MSADDKHGAFFRVIFPILLVLLAAFVAYFVPKWLSRNEKQLSIEIQQNMKLPALGDMVMETTEIPGIGKSLNHLNLLTLRFVNEGQKGIVGRDFVKDIEIKFPSDKQIFGMPKVTNNPANTEVIINKSADGKIAFMNFDLLNAGQDFSCGILYTGEPTAIPSVTVKIVDLNRVLIRNMIQISETRTKEIRSGTSSLIFALLFAILLIGNFYEDTITCGNIQKATIYVMGPVFALNLALGMIGVVKFGPRAYFSTTSSIAILVMVAEVVILSALSLRRTKRKLSERDNQVAPGAHAD